MRRRFLPILPLLLLAGQAPAQEVAAHGGPVRALAVTGDAATLASAGFDQSMILWDPAAGRARAVVRWHQGAVNALAALPNGSGFASAGEDGRIALWPAERPGPAPFSVLEGHMGPVASLATDGNRLASASWDGTARIWPLNDQGAPRVLEGHQGNVNAIVFRTDGIPVTAGFDGTLRAWPESGPPILLAEFGLPQNALVALPDGGLAAGGVDGAVRLLAPDGTVRELAAGSRPVAALAASPDGHLLAAASLGGSVTLWSLPEGRLRHTLEGPGLPVWSVAFAPDGQNLWTGGADRRVRRWDAATGRPLGPAAPEGADAAAMGRPGLDAHGARVFRACAACHSLTAEGGNMAGPHLHGLFGRRMGSLPGYAYSERLARGDITWTPETVSDLFTRGPDVVTPGTKMPVQTVGNAEDLAALLRFLEQATR
jgi:cytochrome c